MANTYLTNFQYLRQPNGLIISGYYANAFYFAALQSQGVNRLTVPSTAITVQMNPYDFLYIFDGPQSEMVQVNATIAPGSTSIALTSTTLYAHTPGVAVCADGTDGSLGEQILTASQWVEDICHQSLWQSTYTETLRMPTMRASIDNQHSLNFRPRHSPVTALSSLVLQTNAATTIPYDPTQAIIDSELLLVSVPNLQGIPGGSNQGSSPYQPVRATQPRQAQAWLVITYTAGFTVLPRTVQRACSLLTNECFATLFNGIGADQIQEGERNVVFTMRGDTSGESLNVKHAYKLLQPYVVEES